MNWTDDPTSANAMYVTAPRASAPARTSRLSPRSPAHASGTTAAVWASVKAVVNSPTTKPEASKILIYSGRSVSSVINPNPVANRVR
jgi:hypothetical protein